MGAVLIVAMPLISLLWRAPWGDLPRLLTTEVVADALLLSVTTSICAAVIALTIGTLVALQLSKMLSLIHI